MFKNIVRELYRVSWCEAASNTLLAFFYQEIISAMMFWQSREIFLCFQFLTSTLASAMATSPRRDSVDLSTSRQLSGMALLLFCPLELISLVTWLSVNLYYPLPYLLNFHLMMTQTKFTHFVHLSTCNVLPTILTFSFVHTICVLCVCDIAWIER